MTYLCVVDQRRYCLICLSYADCLADHMTSIDANDTFTVDLLGVFHSSTKASVLLVVFHSFNIKYM